MSAVPAAVSHSAFGDRDHVASARPAATSARLYAIAFTASTRKGWFKRSPGRFFRAQRFESTTAPSSVARDDTRTGTSLSVTPVSRAPRKSSSVEGL